MRIPGIPYHQGRNNYSDKDGMHYGIAIHNTSNTASDTSEASYADHRTDGTSSHFYVGRDSVTQSLDTNAKAGHAGSGYGNENAIAFEITGTNDKSRDWWLGNVAWGQLGYVIAYILRNDPDFAGFQVRRASVGEMQSNPKVKAFYGHDDMRRAWGGTTHTDPGPNFPWDRLFAAVNEALGSSPAAATPTSGKGDTMIYRAPDGACFVATNTGPVQVLSAELTSMANPQIMQVGSYERVHEYCPPVPSAAAATVSLSDAQFADLKAALAAAGGGLTGEEVEQAVVRALAGAKLTTSFSAA